MNPRLLLLALLGKLLIVLPLNVQQFLVKLLPMSDFKCSHLLLRLGEQVPFPLQHRFLDGPMLRHLLTEEVKR